MKEFLKQVREYLWLNTNTVNVPGGSSNLMFSGEYAIISAIKSSDGSVVEGAANVVNQTNAKMIDERFSADAFVNQAQFFGSVNLNKSVLRSNETVLNDAYDCVLICAFYNVDNNPNSK